MNALGSLFLKYYNDSYGKVDLNPEEMNYLNDLITGFIHEAIGYRFNNNYETHFLAYFFFNIYHNIHKDTFLSDIENYINYYYNTINNHPLTKLFIDTIKWIYSDEYDGKLGSEFIDKPTNIIIDLFNQKLTLRNVNKNNALPEIIINNVDSFEKTLAIYLNQVYNSDSLYNIFNKEGFDVYEPENQIKMLFEGTILNASPKELNNVEELFKKYTNFISNPILPSMKKLSYVGNIFDDELYFKVKESDFEYETPYSMSFMLRYHHYELPLIRIGINNNEANIITTQSSQLTKEQKTISEEIKRNIPKNSHFRYYKPNHLISLIMGIGLLHGIGIDDIKVQTLMPLRYYKTIKDKHMNEEESNNYFGRVLDKSINTYYKLITLCSGLEINEEKDEIIISKNGNVTFNNDFLNNIYNLTYNLGLDRQINPIAKKM